MTDAIGVCEGNQCYEVGEDCSEVPGLAMNLEGGRL